MKRLTILFLTVLTLSSCGNEVEFNSPAFQGNYNGNLWRATSNAADIDFGGFLIQGSNNVEIVQLVTLSDTAGTYNLGPGSPSVAIVKDAEGIIYSTENNPDPSLSLYPAEGQIIVEDVVAETDPKTLIGTFWFTAYSANGLKSVNFNEGRFYKVPLNVNLFVIGNESACLEATQQVNIARNAFNLTDVTMPDYTELCNAYKTALITKIDICGDADGSQQLIIDSLGTCIP